MTTFDAIIIGAGQAGPPLAGRLTSAGMTVAFVFVVAVELFSAVVHPVPPDFGGPTEEMCRHVSHYPHWVLALVVAAWGATAFVSTRTAERIGNRGCGLTTGLLLLAAAAFNRVAAQ